MDKNLYFSKIPQSVLVSGNTLENVSSFVEHWASVLLKTDASPVKKHPDFYAIYPANKMRQINVDALREFNRNIYTSSQQGGRKVFVIYEADRLNIAAANALLKTLEEPTESSSIFLITTRPYDLLPTLRSRCWWVQMPPSEDKNLEENLRDWLICLKKLLVDYLKTRKPLSPLKIYGLLYRLQAYITQKSDAIKVDDELLEEEAKIAQKSRLEKQTIQEVFKSIENILSELVTETREAHIYYPNWIRSLEQCFGRTEVNFGVIPSLETFLLQFCKTETLL